MSFLLSSELGYSGESGDSFLLVMVILVVTVCVIFNILELPVFRKYNTGLISVLFLSLMYLCRCHVIADVILCPMMYNMSDMILG